MKDIETVVSDNIKKLLREYNINQTELAKIAGVSVSTVGKWVLKKATPRMGAVQKISDHFNLPKSYILEEEKAEHIIKESSQIYNYIPAEISAGLPDHVEAVTDTEQIKIPDDDERDRIQRAWIKNLMSDEDLERYQLELDEEQEEIEKELSKLNKPIMTKKEYEQIVLTLKSGFEQLSREDKRAFVQRFIKRIEFKRTLVEGYKQKYDVEVTNVEFY